MARAFDPNPASRRRFLQVGAGLAASLGLAPGLASAQDNPRSRAISSNNLKQIALAFHNYHDVNAHFPASAISDGSGKPLLSWRVAILPYLDEQDLYEQFKLDEPWDSDHNKPLAEKMPKVYGPVGGKPKEAGETYYQVFTGPDTIFPPEKTTGLIDVTDGTAFTILTVEAAEPVVWTKPEDIEFDADEDLPELGGLFEGGFHIGLADGSVRFLKKDVDKDLLKKMITRNRGEVVHPSKLR
jgi:hypothetical protein